MRAGNCGSVAAVHPRLRASAVLAVLVAGALPTLGCASLTRPDDITITAEPIAAAAPAPLPKAAPAAPARPQAAPQAPQAGG